MSKIATLLLLCTTLFALLILFPSCDEKQQEGTQKCDAVCELIRENLKADFERLTKMVTFVVDTERKAYGCFSRSGLITSISLHKRPTGAVVLYKPWTTFLDLEFQEAGLSEEEWLDFVRALHKSDVSKLENKYGEPSAKGEWALEIYSSGKLYPIVTEGFGTYPPNWDGLKKTMEDMNAKIIEKSGKRNKVRGRK